MEVCILTKQTLLVSALFLCALNFLFAEIKVAYVNTERVFSELKEVQDAQQILNGDIQAWEQEIKILEQDLEKLKQEYEEKKLVLTQASKDEALKKISDLETNLKNKYNEIYGENGKIIQRNNELLEPIMTKLTQTIEKISVDNNFTMVFDSSTGGILYAKSTIDITDDVLTEMKKIKN
jgi:outer membrane protein